MSYESLPCLYQVPWIFDTSKLELMKVINTPMLEREPVAIAAKKRKSGASEPEKADKKKKRSSKLTKEQVPLPDEPAAVRSVRKAAFSADDDESDLDTNNQENIDPTGSAIDNKSDHRDRTWMDDMIDAVSNLVQSHGFSFSETGIVVAAHLQIVLYDYYQRLLC